MSRALFVPDGSKLPPAGGHKRNTSKTNTLSFLNKNKLPRIFDNPTTRSMPSSPSLGASRSPLPSAAAPTSAPVVLDEKTKKLQALRTPLIHLLAVRPVSEKFLAQKTCSKQEECLEILQKVGKSARLDPSKWDLSDRTFKELDVWKFNYPSQEDRQSAIDRAISAFDRLRLSREENVWQTLLPQSERGKGKILSKLNLHAGPIQRSSTPKINVQSTQDVPTGGDTTGNDSDSRKRSRLAPGDAEPIARSRSQDSIKKRKVSEKEAQSKRLLGKGPKKNPPISKVKETKPAVKRGGRKLAGATGTTIKSTQFVHDSDEDEEMPDAVSGHAGPAVLNTSAGEMKKSNSSVNTTMSQAKTATPSNPAKPKDLKEPKNAVTPRGEVLKKESSSPRSMSSGSKPRVTDVGPKSHPMKKEISRPKNTTSPHKPSPLGSSPPTNASDFDNDPRPTLGSSSSSSPLITQTRKDKTNISRPGMAQAGPKVASNGGQPPKRKAEDTEKDTEKDLASHNTPSTNGNGDTIKRRKTSTMSPPTPDSSNSSVTSQPNVEIIEKAQRFKMFHAKYEKLYREVSSLTDPQQDKVETLMKMHERLAAMKEEIVRGIV